MTIHKAIEIGADGKPLRNKDGKYPSAICTGSTFSACLLNAQNYLMSRYPLVFIYRDKDKLYLRDRPGEILLKAYHITPR